MNIAKLNKPFVAQTTLTAAQLNNVTDKIDAIIDYLNTPSNNHGDPVDINPDTTPSGDGSNNQSGSSSLNLYVASLSREYVNNQNDVRYTVTLGTSTYNLLHGKNVDIVIQYTLNTTSTTWLTGATISWSNINSTSFQHTLTRPSGGRKYRFRIEVPSDNAIFYTNQVTVTSASSGGNIPTGDNGEQDNSGSIPDHGDVNTGNPEENNPYDPSQPEQQLQ